MDFSIKNFAIVWTKLTFNQRHILGQRIRSLKRRLLHTCIVNKHFLNMHILIISCLNASVFQVYRLGLRRGLNIFIYRVLLMSRVLYSRSFVLKCNEFFWSTNTNFAFSLTGVSRKTTQTTSNVMRCWKCWHSVFLVIVDSWCSSGVCVRPASSIGWCRHRDNDFGRPFSASLFSACSALSLSCFLSLRFSLFGTSRSPYATAGKEMLVLHHFRPRYVSITFNIVVFCCYL